MMRLIGINGKVIMKKSKSKIRGKNKILVMNKKKKLRL